MDFSFTPEQEALRGHLTELLDDVCPPAYAESCDNDAHPLWGLIGVVGDRIREYEDRVHPWPDTSTPATVLASLMEEHGLTQSDLPEVGAQSVVSAVPAGKRELTDETLKKIAHELAENLRKNLTVDWSARESVQAKLRLMVKRILRKYKYPPDSQDAAVELVLQQAKALREAWA